MHPWLIAPLYILFMLEPVPITWKMHSGETHTCFIHLLVT